ncbi:hypothetical protein GCM10023196_087970 [Actinoallomurus vinaceus]|uniref:Uncharacterized protein n=1 Tax=Actinoallomurus vinaceus TaxID=1080074 RepID=A0ABP8UPL9_9ACTN
MTPDRNAFIDAAGRSGLPLGQARGRSIRYVTRYDSSRRGLVYGPGEIRLRALVAGVFLIPLIVIIYAVLIRPLQPHRSISPLTTAGGSLEDLCSRKRYHPESAHFTGPPPHPIALYAQEDQRMLGMNEVRLGVFGKDVAPGGSGPNALRVQLVACAERHDEVATSADCDYNRGIMRLYTATYKIKIFEARTRHQVGSARIVPASPICPNSAFVSGDYSRAKVYATPSADEYRASLSRFVFGRSN